MSQEAPVQVPQQQPTTSQKKSSKKQSKNQNKIVIGASDYNLDNHEQKENEPRQKQHPQKQKQDKPRNHHQQQHRQQQPQMIHFNQQQRFMEMSLSYNITCLLEENCLSCGSFIRKFMDDDGFIKCEIFAKIFACQLNVIENAAKLTEDVNKKIVYDHKKNAIGLAPSCPNYSLPPEERISEIKDEEVRKYQRKAQEWIMHGASKLTFMQN